MPLPYSIELDPNGIYTFTTDLRIEYTCAFTNDTHNLSPLLGIYDFEVFQFVFSEFNPNIKYRETVNGLKQIRPNDERIMPTIGSLLSDFFSKSSLRVLVYICDDTDECHAQRQRLFQIWHKKVPNNVNREQIDVISENSDSNTKHIGILSRLDLEHQDILKTELIDKVESIVSKYF